MTRSLWTGILLAVLAPTVWSQPGHVWIEGEKPDAANFEWTAAGATKSALLSEGRWLTTAKRANLPDEGYVAEYDFEAPENAEYAVWLRVGFEGIRPIVAWSFDDGPWITVGFPRLPNAKDGPDLGPAPDYKRRTTNVTELGYWCAAGWWDVGRMRLTTGRHRLRLRFHRTHLPNPMIALDAIALVAGDWTPNGKLKPGEIYDADIDRQAARQVYKLPAPSGPDSRSEVRLDGLWQIARYDDPDMNVDTYEPVARIPSRDEYDLKWMGAQVPAPVTRVPRLGFAHRVIYRTKVGVPAAADGRAFYLHFSGTNWIVSVFVNGERAGEHRGVWIPWDLDVTKHIKPGQVNELAVAVKGSYYAFDPKYVRGDLNARRDLPAGDDQLKNVFWIAPIYPSTKGDGAGIQYGLVNPVRLVVAGPAYTEDVFIKPSVRNKELVADVTLRNPGAIDRALQVVCEAVLDRDGAVEKTLGPVDIVVPAGGAKMASVRGVWEDPKLWWPLPDPHLYRLRMKVLEGGAVIDTHEELFGFREVTVDGPAILINGARRNFWNWVDVGGRVESVDDYERLWREEGDRFMRFSHGRKLTPFLKTREERLEYYDRTGMAGRLCSMIDGMFITFHLFSQRGANPLLNEPVWEGYRRHIDQLTRAYRNHPSVIMYQIENELIYINGMNISGKDLHLLEKAMLDVHRVGKANDPTRPYTVGGGGDLSKAEGLSDPSEALEINSPHYPTGDLDWYPENAYAIDNYSTKITRWPWTREKPWVVGESAHAGWLRYGSYVSGPIAFRSQDDAARAKARFLRMLYGGYRWAGVAGFFPWDNLSRYEDGRKTFSDLCVIPRKQTRRLYGGRRNELLFKVMNDTFSREPVTFEWAYEVDGRRIAGATTRLSIEPGYGVEQTLVIAPAAVDARAEGTLSLKASQPGAKDYVDVRAIPVMPTIESLSINTPVALFDRSGKVGPFLEQAGATFRGIDSLDDAGNGNGLLVIGPDTLTPQEAYGGALLAFAARGGRVLALEQDNVVAGSNLPAPMKTTSRYGGYAHPQALGAPLFRDLGRDDLIDWAVGHPTYKNVYVKPSQGARSLVECGPGLPYSALVEMAAGDGLIALCQLRVGANLSLDPAADALLRNMLERYADFKPSTAVAAIHAPGNPSLVKKVEETGALHEKVSDIENALDPSKYRVAVIDATAETLAMLNAAKARSDAFQKAGGWIMLCGVRPESIDGFNALAGVDHLLRPFRIERDHMLDTDTPLAATIGDGDVMLYGAEWIAQWKGLRWVSGDTFGYVIDGDDAAPFTYPPGAARDPYDYKPRRDDKDPYNFVNGMLHDDFWKYIRQIWVEGKPDPLVFTTRQPETIAEVRVWNNDTYSTIERLAIVFDGDEANALEMILPDSGDVASLRIDPPRTARATITLQIRSWRKKTGKNANTPNLVGIDNVEFRRAERPSRGAFIDRAGGLVAFPIDNSAGSGGVFLNQIKFLAEEAIPANAAKKVGLLGTLLRNMGVGARTATVAVPGVNIRFDPIDITDACNQYRSSRPGRPGWFGKKGLDLAGLPMGEEHFADVLYHVVDYATAPVPDCIVAPGVKGGPQDLDAPSPIIVARKADVLFFLHAAHVQKPIKDDERERIGTGKRPFVLPEVARYVLRYDNGEEAVIPVVLEKHIDHWLQDEPRQLEQAAVAWTMANGDTRATLYSMKVMNPQPDKKIALIEVQLGQGERGGASQRAIPALLAVTVGTIVK